MRIGEKRGSMCSVYPLSSSYVNWKGPYIAKIPTAQLTAIQNDNDQEFTAKF